MKPRRYFNFLCVLLLLFAQQSALSHVTWHATGQAGDDAHAAHEHSHEKHTKHEGASDAAHDHDEPAGGGLATLCEFDLTFGQLLGGVHGACALPIVAELPASIASYVFNPRLGTEAVPAHSRGPPPRL